jgi:chromosome segregation ATPase
VGDGVGRTLRDVFRTSVERRLRQLSERLRREREELAVVDDQLAHLTGEADDARLRALVSETPLSDHDATTAARHADAMRRRRSELVDSIARLEAAQDELLDRLTGTGT